MMTIDKACESCGVDIVSGHTEVTRGVKEPLVVVTAMGTVLKKNLKHSSGVRPGMDIVATKWIALEGTAILAKEKEAEQKTVLALSALMFICGFVVAGLNFRFDWFVLPNWVSYTGTVLFLLSYLLYAEVLRENTYLSRTIEVSENQKVIDTGLYGIVRHPMYSATLVLFISMPLVLGSLFSLIVFILYPLIIAKRIISEEKFLEKELNGYIEYKKKVKYRLIPFIW